MPLRVMKEPKQVKSDSYSHIPKRTGRLEGIYTRLHLVQQHGTDMLQINTLLMHRWELFAKIGVGAHSEVYAAYDRELGRDVAIKAEKSDARLLNEAHILRALKTTQHFCHYIHYQPTYIVNFLVMNLQGPSLKEIMDYFKPLSWKTVMNIGLQMLEAIKTLHLIGYVHGDIKPSCFLIGLPPDDMATIYLIDFGLSRKLKPNNTTSFRADNQTISSFEKRSLVKAAFQGSYKYASPANHMGFRLGRRDDLWSLLYTLLDLMCDLPWSHVNKQDKIFDMKNRHTDDLINTYIGNEGKTFKNLIKRMNLSDMPNYDQLKACFTRALRHYPSGELQSYEWMGKPNVLWQIDYVRVYDDDKDEEEIEEAKGEKLEEGIEKQSGELLEVLEEQLRSQEIIPEVPEVQEEIRKSLLKTEEGGSGERERRTLVFNPIIETSSEPSVSVQKERPSADVKTSPMKIDEEKEEFPRVPLVVSRLIPISRKCRKHLGEPTQSTVSLRYFTQRPRYVTSKISLSDCNDND